MKFYFLNLTYIMNKNLLYKLPKDILVEFVCKNFNNLSVKEFGRLYREKCVKEMNKYGQLLDKSYSVGGFLVNYKKGGIIYVAKYVGFYRERYIFLTTEWKICMEILLYFKT